MRLERDARFALRLLARSPVFAITAVLSLAAGIASTAAIFSIADALLLRPRVGVTNPGTLVDIGRSNSGQGMDNIGYPLFETMRSETRLFAAMSAHRLSPEVMSLGDAALPNGSSRGSSRATTSRRWARGPPSDGSSCRRKMPRATPIPWSC